MSTKKLELKGKHLATLKLLCQSLSGDGFPAPDMALAQEMAVVISGMQQGEITKETALSIIMRELDISIVDYYHRMKPPFPFDYNDLENIKKESIQKLRNTIENLPYRYSLRIELPSFPIFGAWTFPINNEICVTQGACNFDPPPATHAEALVHALRGSSAKETTFLEFKTSGYATESIDSPALAEAISRAKCCAAIFLHFR